MNGIIHIRNWVRTNGEMSEDGKSITYNCKELESVIAEGLRIHDVVGRSEQLFCDKCNKTKVEEQTACDCGKGIKLNKKAN
jgi:hypothetical protein